MHSFLRYLGKGTPRFRYLSKMDMRPLIRGRAAAANILKLNIPALSVSQSFGDSGQAQLRVETRENAH
jgi:hypothetical protein